MKITKSKLQQIIREELKEQIGIARAPLPDRPTAVSAVEANAQQMGDEVYGEIERILKLHFENSEFVRGASASQNVEEVIYLLKKHASLDMALNNAMLALSFLNSKDPDWHDRLGKEGVFDKLGRWFKGDKK